MSKTLNLNLNLSKILKEKIYEGKTGKFIQLTVYVNDEADQYGNDCSIILSQTQEERQQKIKHYVGNGKTLDLILASKKEEVTSDDGLDF